MRVLLDTHAFIWWDDEQSKLSFKALNVCSDPANVLVLSLVSVWEMQIKIQLGKLNFSISLAEKIKQQEQTNRLVILPVTLRHVLGLNQLPDIHRDPFDRLLISQCLEEDLAIVSHDSIIKKYPVRVIW